MKIKNALKATITLFVVISAQVKDCLEETETIGETNKYENFIVEKSDKTELENLLK